MTIEVVLRTGDDQAKVRPVYRPRRENPASALMPSVVVCRDCAFQNDYPGIEDRRSIAILETPTKGYDRDIQATPRLDAVERLLGSSARGKAKTRGTWWPYIRPCKYTEHPSSIARDDNVDKHGVKGTRAGSSSPSELQDIASKLSALAQQIKTIAAVPLSDDVDLDESGEASRRAAIE